MGLLATWSRYNGTEETTPVLHSNGGVQDGLNWLGTPVWGSAAVFPEHGIPRCGTGTRR